jgi:LAO/AO transport system kinase
VTDVSARESARGSAEPGPAPGGTEQAARAATDPGALVAAARAGDPRALARLISLVENASPGLRDIMRLIAPHTGHARIIGLTGSPGVGKSTITSALVGAYRAQGLRVGVLAVDPTSPFTGGALLGDRVRMQGHACDSGVFIRSMATRGHLGGVSWAAPQALRLLDAAGFDVIMIETVGVGQAEIAVASLADSTLVIVAPGMGDSVQAAKAGILEVADIFVVNKNDRPGAQEAIRDLRTMLSMAPAEAGAWRPPVLAATAAAGEGIDDLTARLAAHAAWLAESGEGDRRRLGRAREEISAIAVAGLRQRLGVLPGEAELEALAARVAAGELDPYAAADSLMGG